MTQLVTQFNAARRVSTPLIAIDTPDQPATVRLLNEATNGDPKLQWDCVRGLVALNDAGTVALGQINVDYTENAVEFLKAIAGLPQHTIIFMLNAHQQWGNPLVIQGIANLRDLFKGVRRTLVLLQCGGELPRELQHDVLSLSEPLPNGEQLAEIVSDLCSLWKDKSGVEAPAEQQAQAIEALRGLSAFAAEQATAQSLGKSGLEINELWDRKRDLIEQTPGLQVYSGDDTYATIGGVPVIKQFLSKVIHGRARPNAVVFVDEIEKSLAGAAGDTSGVSQDQLGALLAYMQDTQAVGVLFVGPPGSAKSAVAKATGNEAGIPTIQLDLGSAKGSLVGQSEANLRTALKVISAVSNERSLWIATCNSIGSLPPELRRRFTLGVFFFDLPTSLEREEIWKIWIGKYELPEQKLPAHEGWTGAEIRQCCDLAWRLDCTLIEASQFVVPVSKSAADSIEKLQSLAAGRFLSASQPGVYSQQKPAAPATRARREFEHN
jgi:hypothetical protein